MEVITVFTPTFNRAYILNVLYESLCRQTKKNFIWLIIDDGSVDNTKQLVDQWMKEKKIKIEYYFQENKGKNSAHNRGVILCNTDLFVCVDSDDFLIDNAMEIVENSLNEIKDEKIAGFVSGRFMISETSCYERKTSSLLEVSTLREYLGHSGISETTLFFKTDVIKRFLFPEIEGEKFIPESYVYNQIDQKYKYRILKDHLVISKYQPDGFVKNWEKFRAANPKGFAMVYNQQLQLFQLNFETKIKTAMLYIIFSRKGHTKGIWAKANCSTHVFLIAWFLSFFYEKRVLGC